MANKIPVRAALIGFLCTAVSMFVCLAVLKTEPQIPLLLGCAFAAAAAMLHGVGWREVLRCAVRGVRSAGSAIVILLLIGVLMGVWIRAGVVPAMVYYGLRLLTPRLFLPSAVLVCAAVSMALGSWGTAGTVGLALMGIASAMGIPLPLAAGAVISGAYVGDKLSPMADSTNLAAAVAELDVFMLVRRIFVVALPTFLLCLGVYALLGAPYAASADVGGQIGAVLTALEQTFRPGLAAFIPLALVLICILCRLNAIPSLLIGAVAGGVYAVAAQGATASELLRCAWAGFSAPEVPELDALLSAGGILSMLYSVSIVVLAMSFAGIMEHTGQMELLMAPLIRRLRGRAALTGAAVISCAAVNVALPDQYVAIALPGRMFAAAFDGQGLPRTELGVAVAVGGALTSALVPWNTCGIFMSGVLGVPTAQYAPCAVYNLLMPLTVILLAVLRQWRGKRKKND
ncbi:MAG: Na+/H+ antiporter NhaC [Oscillospiraceae bacterium]|nr:Na+/H+ antiporter NhaC [Oscillospiraceae bacterium]